MKVVFENQDLISVFKPANWLSVPSHGGSTDPRPVVGLELQRQLGQRIFPLHRLDYGVSGILAFAKTPESQRKILRSWEKGKVRKVYQALTSPQNFDHWPEERAGSLREAFMESSTPWVSSIVAGKKRSFVAPHGDKSITRYQKKEQTPRHILWELEPVTGRRHQLRLELSRRGFPIWGDELYGGQKRPGQPEGIALVAILLHIQDHPEMTLDWNWEPWM
jgi:23S rRNA-/tRNA-specific pseudouridylate synthase